MLVSSGRSGRPWQGREEPPPPEERPRCDPTCYLCPRNARAGGERDPDYGATFAFTNDFAALQPDAPETTFRVGSAPRDRRGPERPGDLLLAAPRSGPWVDGRRVRPRGRRRVGRRDRRVGRAIPVGPGLREPRRGDGRLKPAPARPDLGGERPCRGRRRWRTCRSAHTTPCRGHGCSSTTRVRSAAARGSSATATIGWRWSRSGPHGRSRHCWCRTARLRAWPT